MNDTCSSIKKQWTYSKIIGNDKINSCLYFLFLWKYYGHHHQKQEHKTRWLQIVKLKEHIFLLVIPNKIYEWYDVWGHQFAIMYYTHNKDPDMFYRVSLQILNLPNFILLFPHISDDVCHSYTSAFIQSQVCLNRFFKTNFSILLRINMI